MDFEVFSKNELEDMYNAMETNMSEAQKNIFIDGFIDIIIVSIKLIQLKIR